MVITTPEEHVGLLISRVQRVSTRVFKKMLKQYKDLSINPAQGRILFVLWQKDNIPISQLVEDTSLAKSTLTSHLDKLEEKGLIVRLASPGDRRETLVKLEGKIQQLERSYFHAINLFHDIMFKDMNEKDIKQLVSLLERVLRNLEEHELKEDN